MRPYVPDSSPGVGPTLLLLAVVAFGDRDMVISESDLGDERIATCNMHMHVRNQHGHARKLAQHCSGEIQLKDRQSKLLVHGTSSCNSCSNDGQPIMGLYKVSPFITRSSPA